MALPRRKRAGLMIRLLRLPATGVKGKVWAGNFNARTRGRKGAEVNNLAPDAGREPTSQGPRSQPLNYLLCVCPVSAVLKAAGWAPQRRDRRRGREKAWSQTTAQGRARLSPARRSGCRTRNRRAEGNAPHPVSLRLGGLASWRSISPLNRQASFRASTSYGRTPMGWVATPKAWGGRAMGWEGSPMPCHPIPMAWEAIPTGWNGTPTACSGTPMAWTGTSVAWEGRSAAWGAKSVVWEGRSVAWGGMSVV